MNIRIRKIALILSILMVFTFISACVEVPEKQNTGNKTTTVADKTLEEFDNDAKLLYGEMEKVDYKDAARPFKLWLEQTSRDYTYRESQGYETYAPVKDETAVLDLKVDNKDEGKDLKTSQQISFKRIMVPNDFLLTMTSSGNYGLRTQGYVKYNDQGKMDAYSFSIMGDEELQDVGTEPISEMKFENGHKKFMMLGMPRNKIVTEQQEPEIGYQGIGRPREDVLTLQLIKTITPEKYLDLANESKYLMATYATEDKEQYQCVFDNRKLFDFMQLIYKELAKSDNRLYKEYLSNLEKIGLTQENGLNVEPFDYEYTVENLLQSLVQLKELNNTVEPFINLRKAIEDSYGKNFDKRLTSISFIIGKVGEVKDGSFVEGKEDTIRHLRKTKYYTDFIVHNTTITYIDYKSSPDLESLESNEKELAKSEIKKEASKYLSDTTLGSIGRSAIIAQLGLDTEVTREDIKNKIKSLGKEMKTLKELKELKNVNIYENLTEGAYIGMDKEMSLSRKTKLDSSVYWLNQYLEFCNQVQDYGDEYPVTFEGNGLKFHTIEMDNYWINNVVTDEFIEELNKPKEEQNNQEEQNNAEITNETLKDLVDSGHIIVNGDPEKAKTLNNIVDMNLYELKMDNGKKIGDFVKDKTKPTVIMFGEHWCGFCIATLQYLNNKQEFFDKYNYVMLTSGNQSDFDNDPEIDKYNNIINHIHFNETSLSEKLGVSGYPTLFITDENGNGIYMYNTISGDPALKSLNETVDGILSYLKDRK